MKEDRTILEQLKERVREELQNQNRVEEEELNSCIERNIDDEG